MDVHGLLKALSRSFTAGRQSARRRPRALTLVELLVVIVIIVVLVGSVMVAGTSVINTAKQNNTKAILQIVADAVEEFKRERPGITRAKQRAGAGRVKYVKRYGLYPPDELEVFTGVGLPGSAPPGGSLAVGGSMMVPPAAFDPMRFFFDGSNDDLTEHRDLAAMIVAIETLSETAAAVLDRIPDRNRSPGLLDEAGKPAQFLDRNGNRVWDSGDHQIRYILDDWGRPISYFAQRDWTPGGTSAPSSNHAGWNKASTEFIRLNDGKPLLMSYGADGDAQFTQDVMGSNADASLVGDFENEDDEAINHPLNADNVYTNPKLTEKLNAGIAP